MKEKNQKTTKLVLMCEKVHDKERCKYYDNYYLVITDYYENGNVKTIDVPIKVSHNSQKAINYLTRVLNTHSEIIQRDYEKK